MTADHAGCDSVIARLLNGRTVELCILKSLDAALHEFFDGEECSPACGKKGFCADCVGRLEDTWNRVLPQAEESSDV